MVDSRLPPGLAYGPADCRRIAAAKHRLLERDERPVGIRPEVVASWRRSQLSGVDAGVFAVPRVAMTPREGLLLAAAKPVVARIERDLEGSGVWCLLLDRDCRLLAAPVGDLEAVRRAEDHGAVRGALFSEDRMGTNGAGTALEERRGFVVLGPEHFHDAAGHLLTAGWPVRDPLTHRLLGLVGLNCRLERANVLLLPYAAGAVQAIEAQILGRKSPKEQALFHEFVRIRRRSDRPVAAFGVTITLLDSGAQAVLAGSDDGLLRRAVHEAAAAGDGRHVRLPIGPDRWADGLCTPVFADSPALAGVVVELSETPSCEAPVLRRRASRGGDLQRQVASAADRSVPVVVRGEPGTGKRRLALHRAGDAVVLDAVAAEADPMAWRDRLRDAARQPGATVVVTHLDRLPPRLVADVQDLLGAGRVRLRATGSPAVLDAAALGSLAYELAVVDVPALRERLDELPDLVHDLLVELGPPYDRLRCDPAALAALRASSWPGNVRQLRQVVVSAALRSDGPTIGVDDLPSDLVEADPRRHLTKMEQLERAALLDALRQAGNEKALAADLLGVSRATVYRKLEHFGVRAAAPSRRQARRV